MRDLRYDDATHTYTDARGEVPHITGLLAAAGWIDDAWFTPDHARRGTAVHQLTTDHDLGVVVGDTPYAGYLAAHVKCVDIVRPEWLHIEEIFGLDAPRFAGRPDRVARVSGALAVWEIKSGPYSPAHAIQTALQAILVAPTLGVPAGSIQRYGEYLQPTGRFKVEQFVDARDFTQAARILQKFC
jgi:hypothetical protein